MLVAHLRKLIDLYVYLFWQYHEVVIFKNYWIVGRDFFCKNKVGKFLCQFLYEYSYVIKSIYLFLRTYVRTYVSTLMYDCTCGFGKLQCQWWFCTTGMAKIWTVLSVNKYVLPYVHIYSLKKGVRLSIEYARILLRIGTLLSTYVHIC